MDEYVSGREIPPSGGSRALQSCSTGLIYCSVAGTAPPFWGGFWRKGNEPVCLFTAGAAC